MCPCRRFVRPRAGQNARLGGDVTRYVFIVEDLHLLLLAGLPAHYQAPEPLTVSDVPGPWYCIDFARGLLQPRAHTGDPRALGIIRWHQVDTSRYIPANNGVDR
jgi:hypothetical protein